MQVNPGLSIITRNPHPHDHITDVASTGWIPVVAGAVAAIAGAIGKKKKKAKAPPPPPKSKLPLVLGGVAGVALLGGIFFALSRK